MEESQHSSDGHSRLEHYALMGLKGAALSTAAISLVPFLPGLGQMGANAYNDALNICTSAGATGFAGVVSGAMSHVPLIGTYLATGGIFNGLLALGIGLSGLVTSHYLEKYNHPTAARIVRWASISTSILVSLPALLPALSMGLNYLGFLGFGGGSMEPGSLQNSLVEAAKVIGKLGEGGASAAYSHSGSAIIASFGHLLTCGLAAGSTVLVSHTAKAGPRNSIQAGESYASHLFADIAANHARA